MLLRSAYLCGGNKQDGDHRPPLQGSALSNIMLAVFMFTPSKWAVNATNQGFFSPKDWSLNVYQLTAVRNGSDAGTSKGLPAPVVCAPYYGEADVFLGEGRILAFPGTSRQQ